MLKKVKKPEALKRFLKDTEKRYAILTLESYERYISRFLGQCNCELWQIMQKDVVNWLSELISNSKKDGTRTRNTCLMILRSFFTYCQDEDYIKKDPTLNIELIEIDQEMCYLTPEELFQLYEAAKNNPRDHALIDLLYVTALRVSEASDLLKDDVYFKHFTVHVRVGKGTRAGYSVFDRLASVRLKDYLETRKDNSDYLFVNCRGKQLSRVGIFKIIKKYAAAAGIKKSISPHTLRHTCAARMAENGAPPVLIKYQLRHANYASSKDYTHFTEKFQ